MPVVPAEGFVYNGLNREVVDGATATGVCVQKLGSAEIGCNVT